MVIHPGFLSTARTNRSTARDPFDSSLQPLMAEITDEWIERVIVDSIAHLDGHGQPCGCLAPRRCAYHDGMEDGLKMAQTRARELPAYARPMKAGWPDRPITWNDSALQRWIDTED